MDDVVVYFMVDSAGARSRNLKRRVSTGVPPLMALTLMISKLAALAGTNVTQ
jgi:hypothetical protein